MARVEPGVITGRLPGRGGAARPLLPARPQLARPLHPRRQRGRERRRAAGAQVRRHPRLRARARARCCPTGEMLRTGHRTIKGVAGYDLTALLVGSEGTLAIVTEITLKLLPRPRHVATALVAFAGVDDGGPGGLAGAGPGGHPALPRADGRRLAARPSPAPRRAASRPAPGRCCWWRPTATTRSRSSARSCGWPSWWRAEAQGEVLVAQDEAQRREIWEMRRYLSVNLKAVHPHQALRGHRGAALAHPRDGGARQGHRGAARARGGHLRPRRRRQPPLQRPVRPGRGAPPGGPRRWRRSCAPPSTWAGPSPASTGWGWPSATSWSYEQGPEVVALQRRLKAVFDPLGILNPGKIFPPA